MADGIGTDPNQTGFGVNPNNSGIGVNPNNPGLGLNPNTPGYGLSPREAAQYKQMEEMQKQQYDLMVEQAKRQAEIMKKIDPKKQAALADIQSQLYWLQTNKDCADRIQALAASTRPVLGSKEFIFNKDSVIIPDGKKTMIYSDKGLAIISGPGNCNCQSDSTKKIREGLQSVFDSTLPKTAPAGLQGNDGAAQAYRNRMKDHLNTLVSCQPILGSEYVTEIANKYLMTEKPLSPAKIPVAPAATR